MNVATAKRFFDQASLLVLIAWAWVCCLLSYTITVGGLGYGRG